MEHRGHQQADRLVQVDQVAQPGIVEYRVRVAQVGAEHLDGPLALQDLIAVQLDERVLVDVDDPRVGHGALHDLVGVADGGQAGSDVDELPDVLPCDESRGPLVETAVAPRGLGQLRHLGAYLLGRYPVNFVIVLAAEEVVVQSRGRCDGGLGAVSGERDIDHGP